MRACRAQWSVPVGLESSVVLSHTALKRHHAAHYLVNNPRDGPKINSCTGQGVGEIKTLFS